MCYNNTEKIMGTDGIAYRRENVGKRIIPIIITVIAVLFFLLWGSMPALGGLSGGLACLFMLIAVGFICVLVVNLFKRLEELSEEDDEDISKY